MLQRAMKTFITLLPEGLENMTPTTIDYAIDNLLEVKMYGHLGRAVILEKVYADYNIDATYWQQPDVCIFER